MAARILCRLSKGAAGAARAVMLSPSSRPVLRLMHATTSPSVKLFKLGGSGPQRFGFSSSSYPQPDEKEADGISDEKGTVEEEDSLLSNSSSHVDPVNERTAFSDSDAEPELAIEDLAKLVADKEELLKLKHKEIEKMQEKVLLSYADMENVIDRTKREAENSKKFAIQNFAQSLLDVSDNLGRASLVVKESSSKMDPSKDSAGAVKLLKTLLEGVEMTEKQLMEVFRKYGVEKFDPSNERFDPHRHLAVFKIPDDSKPPGTVGAVLKPGYMLYDRVLRPAEVGVTEEASDDPAWQTPGE
ncbi:unnamed protein product [Spirodela intermedia]|uniref:GrpE protein homolog n=1 Tax=Spirodela intermedia TaxID=51605 RepID=A0A7I8JQC4_SPIIN|nr:unnamed protein product [Spirodela intermedia]CAA6672368.1 unnamed protein product [Spirodela intermedia]